MPTVAEQIGQTPHLSPLLRRLRHCGLAEPEDLRRLAVARGCWHYRRPDDDLHPPTDPGRKSVSNLELAMGMLTAAQRFDPVLVRCAAQLLSGDGIPVAAIVRLARQERAVPVVCHIAQAAVSMDLENRGKWEQLLASLPAVPAVAEGRLPHRTRFVLESGLSWRNGRLEARGNRVWLRPRPALRSR